MTAREDCEPTAAPAARAGSWIASHPVEIAFAVLVAAAFVYTLRITSHSYFFADDWLLIRQAGSARGLLRPYNNHLSIIILCTYRVVAEVFGFAYTPVRVVGLVSLFAVPWAYFLTARRQFGAVLAALLALPLLWYGRYVSLNPSELNHYLALLGGIGCAAALNRGRRADRVLAAALAFSLCSAGGGVAVAAACVVHCVCVRPHWRRWIAVLVPSALWLVWWLIEVGHNTNPGPYSQTTSQKVRLVRDLVYAAFDGAALGNAVIAVVLVLAFLAYGAWVVSRGLRAASNYIAWLIGALVWVIGVASSRGLLASPAVFRYRYVALGFVLLAVVPRRPITWPARFPIETNRRWAIVGALVVLALGSARGLAVRSDLQGAATKLSGIGGVTRGDTLVVELGPTVVPDDAVLPFLLGGLPAGELRALFTRYGRPFSVTRGTIDAQLVDMGVVRAFAGGKREGECNRLGRPFTFRPDRTHFVQLLRSPDSRVAVSVRRFGNRWVRLGQARPGRILQLVLPSLGSDHPYQIRANGACRMGVRQR